MYLDKKKKNFHFEHENSNLFELMKTYYDGVVCIIQER